MDKIKIGVSSCLLGNRVRYDGYHSLNECVVKELSKYFDYLGVCPEIECGLKTPREPMRLVGNFKNPNLITSITNIDYTDRMSKWIKKKIKDLAQHNLSGFIFKSKSPSSGISGVKLYDLDGFLKGKTIGLFAKAFIKNFPKTPFEEDYRLDIKNIKNDFVKAVFAYSKNR